MRKSMIFSLVTLFVLMPVTLYVGSQLSGRWYYLTSTLIIIETMGILIHRIGAPQLGGFVIHRLHEHLDWVAAQRGV